MLESGGHTSGSLACKERMSGSVVSEGLEGELMVCEGLGNEPVVSVVVEVERAASEVRPVEVASRVYMLELETQAHLAGRRACQSSHSCCQRSVTAGSHVDERSWASGSS